MLYLVSCGCGDADRQRRCGALLGELSDNIWSGLDHLWIIESDKPATEIRNRIKVSLEKDEALIVALLAEHAAWHGFDHDSVDWLLAHL